MRLRRVGAEGRQLHRHISRRHWRPRREPRSRGPKLAWGCDSGESAQKADNFTVTSLDGIGGRDASPGAGAPSLLGDATPASRRRRPTTSPSHLSTALEAATRAQEQGPQARLGMRLRRVGAEGRQLHRHISRRHWRPRREPRSRGPKLAWGCDSGESAQKADNFTVTSLDGIGGRDASPGARAPSCLGMRLRRVGAEGRPHNARKSSDRCGGRGVRSEQGPRGARRGQCGPHEAACWRESGADATCLRRTPGRRRIRSSCPGRASARRSS